ncbi:Acetyltransferase (GNAT) family [Serratia entomophila]|uniref:bifunctional helix-turn-helix transcriptional regulator/GNAT family N-acetyltransferase n=1 Tax=Serratia entomophila TaxID=42906 RepID=UPI00217BAE26|nr:helix-turn-helix domain-containing GNAT family N-acetyltransferase [Serratia entomophila]CAI0803456.1 Acetyltransferase (GNAT) family [Serratia entomophila]CAI1546524.1 Acetyltransferase (GNAT) family [Serratia entomophila]CAI1638944.1 Acetyltransferase (GNAT) family [Serratia entomophila]CAI2007601.1 Acetyltransferase (GNAT) family [Serratia entomophila]
MSTACHTYLQPIRDASRQLVRELGFMGSTLAGTDMPPSAVHALIEIGEQRANTAAALCGILNLEKSSVSRMLSKLIKAGQLANTPSDTDAREKLLMLTDRGRETLASINRFAERQVMAALTGLPPGADAAIATGLQTYAAALRSARAADAPAKAAIEIVSGYRPGFVARTLEMHMQYYARTVGFGAFFEAKVGAMLADLAARLSHPQNETWLALGGGRILGSISIDGEGLGDNRAHLRAFIVDDVLRGSGIGRQLLAKAVNFCDEKPFRETHLWTFKGLDSARHLYESAGFVLNQEQPGTQWGKPMTEQLFVRRGVSPAA